MPPIQWYRIHLLNNHWICLCMGRRKMFFHHYGPRVFLYTEYTCDFQYQLWNGSLRKVYISKRNHVWFFHKTCRNQVDISKQGIDWFLSMIYLSNKHKNKFRYHCLCNWMYDTMILKWTFFLNKVRESAKGKGNKEWWGSEVIYDINVVNCWHIYFLKRSKSTFTQCKWFIFALPWG